MRLQHEMMGKYKIEMIKIIYDIIIEHKAEKLNRKSQYPYYRGEK